ncbi:MAG TPA: ankyrin repeat domain-containing protein, partial [Verrucomicrobiae bacterium]|nr:ankyrin repeat domain-containing protein [Verrucomicrobiae bacterium]
MAKGLKEAIDANDPAAVAAALKGVKDINRKLPGASAPFLYACEKGADKVLETLIKAGAIVEKRNMYGGETPFWAAAQKGAFAVMKRLMELKQVSEGTLAFAVETAGYEGKLELLEFLLKEAKPAITIQTLRLAAASPKAADVFKMLLKYGADPNLHFDKPGEAPAMTPLHEFADSEKPAVIRALAGSGANVNAQDGLGRTPLMIQAAGFERDSGAKQMEMLKTLLELGAAGALADKFGNDAIDYLAVEFLGSSRKAPKEVIEILRKAGAKGNAATVELFEAIRKNDLKKIQAAIKNGADINRVSPSGGTPLGWAVSDEPESEQLVDILLKAGADPNRSRDGQTVLMRAARRGNLAVIKRLIEAGADVNTVYRSGEYIENAYSAADGNEEIRKFLKSLGAGIPKYEEAKALQAGVASWNDFSELLVKSDVKNAAEGLAKLIGGKVTMNVYGKTVTPGKPAYVVIRPKGMEWSNIFQIAPPPNRFEDLKKKGAVAAEIARSCHAPVLSIDYSDTSDAASIVRVEPSGKKTEDKGWDSESLQEMVDALGEEAPAW